METPTINILHYSTQQDILPQIQSLLAARQRGQFTLEWTADFNALLDSIQRHAYDVYLIHDHTTLRGNQAVWQTVADAFGPLPILVLADKDTGEAEIEAGQLGALEILFTQDLTPTLLEYALISTVKQHRALLNQQAAETRYQQLLKNSSDAVYILDFAGHLLEANDRAVRLLGLETNDLASVSFLDFLTPAARPDFAQSLARMAEDKEVPTPHTYHITTNNGPLIALDIEAQAVWRAGEPWVVQAIARQAKASPVECDEQTNLAQLPAMLWVVDSELYIGDVYGTGIEQAAAEGLEFSGKHLDEILPDGESREFHLNTYQAALQGQSGQHTLQLGSRYFLVRVNPLFDNEDDEQVTGCLALVVDISEQQQKTDALEHSRSRIKQQLDEQSLLNRIDRETGHQTNIEEVIHLTARALVERTEAQAAVVAWIEPSARQLTPILSIGPVTLLSSSIDLKPLRQSDLPFAPYFQEDPDLAPIMNQEQGWLILPLQIDQQAVGIIGLEQMPAKTWTDLKLDFLAELAERAALALENTRVQRRAKYYAEQMDRLYEISSAITGLTDRDEVMVLSARGLAVLMNATSAFFIEHSPENNTLTVTSNFVVAGMTDNIPPIGAVFEMAKYKQTLSALYEEPIPVRDGAEFLAEPERELMHLLGLRSALLVPINQDGTLLGIIVLCESRYRRYWLPDEIALARNLGAQTAIALQHANRFSSLQALGRAKSELIQMTGHDLRNPLSQITGYLDLLKIDLQGSGHDEQLGFLENMGKAVQKIDGLLDDILNLERAENQMEAMWEPIIIAELVHEVCDSQRPQAELAEHEFVCEVSLHGDRVRGSDILLKQAFVNLISNAIKYTPPNGRIVIRGRAQEERYYFEVQDNGYGIPEERQKRLFQRFYRAHAPGTERISGTGLGLSLVKTIVERHGGQVWFRSTYNVGSTFGLWLPLINNNQSR